jgi:hypothetical protein
MDWTRDRRTFYDGTETSALIRTGNSLNEQLNIDYSDKVLCNLLLVTQILASYIVILSASYVSGQSNFGRRAV